jgi:hypothetical protein
MSTITRPRPGDIRPASTRISNVSAYVDGAPRSRSAKTWLRDIETRLDRHLKSALDDALRLSLRAISLDREIPVLGNLADILRELRQLPV